MKSPARPRLSACLARALVLSSVFGVSPRHSAYAQAASVSPHAVLLSDVRPSGALTVLNPNDAPINVALSTRYGWVTTEHGTGRTVVRFADDSVAPPNSAARLVRFAPARFQLAPGSSQVVRFIAVAPSTLEEGEYWARVTVAASAANDDASDSTVRVHGSVNIEVQTVVPLFLRKGRLATALTGTLPRVTRHHDTLRVHPKFERMGRAAAIGMLQIEILDRDNTVLTTVLRQLAVYDHLEPRYDLALPAAVLHRARRVRLTVKANRPDLPEGLPLPFPPLILSADVDSATPTEAWPPDDARGSRGSAPPTAAVETEGGSCLVASSSTGLSSPMWEAAEPRPDGAVASPPVHAPELACYGPGGEIEVHRPADHPSDTATVTRAPPRPSPVPVADDALAILSVVYGDEELGTILTQDSGTPNRPLLPLLRFGMLVGAQVHLTRSDSAIRVRMPSVLPTEGVVDLSTGRASRHTVGARSEVRTFGPRSARRVDDDWFVDADVLEWLTGIGLRIDVPTATLLLEARRERIPRFSMMLARRDRRLTTNDPMLTVPLRPLERVHWSGLSPQSLSATYLHSIDNQTGDFTSAITIGTTVLGGGLAVDVRSNRFDKRTRSTADVTWMGGSPTNRFLRQWRLGSGSSTGPVSTTGRGVSLSNSPFLRSRQLGAVVRSGKAPPGAEIELTRNGQVIGVTLADSSGQWALPMPVDFGQNTIEIAVYTAAGVTRQATLLSLEQDLIPARTIEYGVTVQDNDTPDGECRRRRSPCGYLSNADLRVGLATRYTARLGAYALRPHDGGARQHVPYAALVASPVDWMQLRGEGTASGWWRARAVLQPNLHLRLELGEETMQPGHVPFWLQQQAQFRTRERTTAVMVRPLRDLGRAWLSSQWHTAEGVHGRIDMMTGTAGVRIWRTLVQATFDHVSSYDSLGGRFTTATRGASLTFPQIPRGPQWLRRSFVMVGGAVDAQWQPRGLSSQLSMSLFRRLYMQGSVDWVRGNRTPSFRMQLQHQGTLAMLFQDIASGVGGRMQSSTTMMGTAAMSAHRQGVLLSSDFVALRSSVSGIAYEDRNGNGRFDPTEPRLPDVAIRVAGQVVRTDEQGRYLVRGLPVMDAIPVAPSSETVLVMDGRTLLPAMAREWAMLVPYGETRIDVPFAEATVSPNQPTDSSGAGSPPRAPESRRP